MLRVFDSNGNPIAENERYYGTDSYLSLTLTPGVYYVGVSSTGNDAYNALVADSGGGGTTQGDYELEIQFTPQQTAGLTDAAGVLLDGNGDYQPGGIYNFWFNTQTAANTIFVDKTPPTTPSGTLGSITNPYTNLATALAASSAGKIVRIEGNDPDGNPNDLSDEYTYEIGTDAAGNPLPDGTSLDVPLGVTVMIDAGAILKFRSANVNVGTISQGVSHAGGALQVLGTPTEKVYFTSFNDTSVGRADNLAHPNAAAPGDWGGIVFHSDSDYEADGIFLDYVNGSMINYGGGEVLVNSQLSVYDPIHIIDSQPTISNNTIINSADAAMSADPNAFQDLQFQSATYSQDYGRIGPNLHGNILSIIVNNVVNDNAINGMFIRIATSAGASIDTLSVAAGLVDTDIAYILSENLEIIGGAGGTVEQDANGDDIARPMGRLLVAPGVVVKLSGADRNHHRLQLADCRRHCGKPGRIHLAGRQHLRRRRHVCHGRSQEHGHPGGRRLGRLVVRPGQYGQPGLCHCPVRRRHHRH